MRDQDIIEQVAAQVLQELRNRPRGWQTSSDPLEGFGTGPQASCSCGGSRTPAGPPTTTRRILAAGACRVSALYPKGPIQDEISACIDHTLLKPEATPEQVERLCLEARENQFASVCVNPVYVALCAQLLQGSGVAVCTVVGFPLGSNTTEVKVFETRKAVDEGASEIDMVIHVGALKAGEFARVRDDIQSVNEACGHRAFLKVIIEAALLTDEEKIQASTLSKLAGAEFVKTSTGFGPGGATIHDVELMRRTVGEALGVKAAGGIRDRQTAEDMIRAGADRIGASASVKIIREGSTSTS